MAGMNLGAKRHDHGVSVFWLILVTGAVVFILLAIFIYSADVLTDRELAARENQQDVTLVGDDDVSTPKRPVDSVGATEAGDASSIGSEIVEPAAPAAGSEAAGAGNPVAAEGAVLPADTVAVPAEVGSTAPVRDALDLPPGEGAIPSEGVPPITSGDAESPGEEASDVVVPTLSGPEGADNDPLTPE